MNIVWLREHNRLAGILAEQNSGWDDERLFQTARNIAIVLLLKLVVEKHIAHIGPFDFPIEAVPLIADGERWNNNPLVLSDAVVQRLPRGVRARAYDELGRPDLGRRAEGAPGSAGMQRV